MTLRILNATARDGATWVSRAFAVFLKKPLAFSALFALFLFAALILLLLPFVGIPLRQQMQTGRTGIITRRCEQR